MKNAIGIDFGEARIGVAGADALGLMAHPLETIDARGGGVVERIKAICEERRAQCIVLGLPRNMNGTFGAAAEKAREFARELRTKLGIDVIEWDERMTTLGAQRALRESGRNTKKGRSVIDQAAAQIILQNWLDAQAIRGGRN
jgi:putative Holliday junction resolvase